jgi:hypothetical protein
MTMMSNIIYWKGVLLTRLSTSFIPRYIRKVIVHVAVLKAENILERKYGKGEKAREHLARFLRYKVYVCSKKSRECYDGIYKFIADYSAETGIPQWELRALIERDFGVDI